MKKEPCPNCKRMEIALKVIRTWASHYHDNFWTFQDQHHMKNLLDIKKKCDEVLDGEKNSLAKSSHKL